MARIELALEIFLLPSAVKRRTAFTTLRRISLESRELCAEDLLDVVRRIGDGDLQADLRRPPTVSTPQDAPHDEGDPAAVSVEGRRRAAHLRIWGLLSASTRRDFQMAWLDLMWDLDNAPTRVTRTCAALSGAVEMTKMCVYLPLTKALKGRAGPAVPGEE